MPGFGEPIVADATVTDVFPSRPARRRFVLERRYRGSSAAAPIPSRSSRSAISTSRSSFMAVSVAATRSSSWWSMTPTRSAGAIDLRSVRAAFSLN
jgi:hypothetical protein